MCKSKIFSLITVVLILLGIAMVDCALAEEQKKATGTSIRTKFHPIKVGDEEGHILAVFESTVVYVDSDTGERSVGKTKGLLDMNIKTGKGTMTGYGERTFPNGDKYFSEWEGKPVGKGISQGTYKIVKGTGSLEGLTGEGSWKSTSLAPGVSTGEYAGVRRMPGN